MITSPANPLIIASASDDTTARIWSLDPIHSEQPCVGILGGENHSWYLLSIVWHSLTRNKSDDRPANWFFSLSLSLSLQAFHQTGRYILSAGHDRVISMVNSKHDHDLLRSCGPIFLVAANREHLLVDFTRFSQPTHGTTHRRILPALFDQRNTP